MSASLPERVQDLIQRAELLIRTLPPAAGTPAVDVVHVAVQAQLAALNMLHHLGGLSDILRAVLLRQCDAARAIEAIEQTHASMAQEIQRQSASLAIIEGAITELLLLTDQDD